MMQGKLLHVFKVENSGLRILSSFHDCSDTLYAWDIVLQQHILISSLHCEVPWSWFLEILNSLMFL